MNNISSFTRLQTVFVIESDCALKPLDCPPENLINSPYREKNTDKDKQR